MRLVDTSAGDAQETIEPLEFHDLTAVFPEMAAAELDSLTEDIAQHGLREPILTFQGKIIDGRNRYRACLAAGVHPDTREYTGSADDLLAFVVSLNLYRRHLNESQRAQVGDRVAELMTDSGANLHLDSLGQAAELLRVSRRSVASARKVRRDGVDELGAAVGEGRVAVSTAADVATLAPNVQHEVVARGEKAILKAAKQIRAAREKKRRGEKRSKLADKALRTPPPLDSLPHAFSIIYADAAWRYGHSISASRDIENHYPTMTTEEICNMPVSKVCTDDAALFLWAPSPLLANGMRVIEAWGFTYKTCAVWDKEIPGTGFWFRQQHELLLVAVRGNMPAAEQAGRVPSVIRARRSEHSAKPNEVYEIIEAMYPGLPYLELFARRERPGWTAWGNEVGVLDGNDGADEPAPSKILVVKKMPDGTEVPVGRIRKRGAQRT